MSKMRGIVPHLQFKPVSHATNVCRLYKAGIKVIRSDYFNIFEQRYHMCILRKRFDDHKDIKDFRVAKALLAAGWEEHDYKRHYQPFSFPESDGGVMFERMDPCVDHHLDSWHPLEKAFYPDYFERRERRKQEFIDRWNTKYGTPTQEEIDEALWFVKPH